MVTGSRSFFVDEVFVSVMGPRTGVPVLLIHGSTETGLHDFTVGSDLARRLVDAGHLVIVPDCPGHGRSAAVRNADGSLQYSFASMADALAKLISALSYGPAHVVGHSNGGTIALYLARYHRAAVRRVVALAANAYLDARIIDGVPSKMAPERIERERPEWRDEMVGFHDRWHGDRYWRELVQATINETITHPQWSKAELIGVGAEVLAVQGSEDSVNVPGRHAQTIGEWFPHGSALVVDGAGHSVHWERGQEFFDVVEAFFTDGVRPS